MNGKESPRVAWLFPSMNRGSYWHPILSEFTKILQQTTVYTGFWPGFTSGFEGTFTVEVVGKTKLTESTRPLPKYSRGVAFASPSIVGHLFQFKPQVIFTSGFSIWTLLALLFKPLGRWKIIIAYEGSSPTVDCCDSKLRLMLRRTMVRFTDAFITNSIRGKGYLTKILKVEESRVFAKPYEVPDSKALSGEASEDDLGLQHPVFLYMGQLILRKGLHLLLEACAILQKQGYRNYSILIVGDGPQRDELEHFSQKHDLQDRIQWVKWIEYVRLNTYFRSADVFVLPSLEDTWGMVVLEAMVFGKPVLCSKWAGASEMVVEGENGYVFDPHEPEELAKIMIRFINEPELIASMRKKSQQIMTRYTPEAAAQFLAEVTFAVNSTAIGQDAASNNHWNTHARTR